MAFDLAWVRSRLPDSRIDWHPSIESTMLEASRLAAAACHSGTIVGAEEQTAGQGRHGRAWHSESGSGLYVSIVLRHRFAPNTLPLVTLALGLAAREAILQATDLVCDLRWPNDVLIQSRKCAGILTQLESSAIIAGIGINVNHSTFPEELTDIATSLRLATHRIHSREQLLVELAGSVDRFCTLLEKEGGEPILAMFSQASSFVHGRRVSVDQGHSSLEGTTAGLNSSGFLILQRDDGTKNVILAGGVRPCS
ncbi:MAG TPA: biotin--[acetyl-CoA-carboxylase] ligase [Bryobacteraceae bacterium]|jgi:BirA family biotin operon repressor/biotin-[acetyl-CoA-carboxylase] ligase|nr:biotin--[acetyl-CoA-carboxylase] ligase [Bryobacteraceae bacterium]